MIYLTTLCAIILMVSAWYHSWIGMLVSWLFGMVFLLIWALRTKNLTDDGPDFWSDTGRPASEENAIRDDRPRPGTDAAPAPNAPRKPAPKPAATEIGRDVCLQPEELSYYEQDKEHEKYYARLEQDRKIQEVWKNDIN